MCDAVLFLARLWSSSNLFPVRLHQAGSPSREAVSSLITSRIIPPSRFNISFFIAGVRLAQASPGTNNEAWATIFFPAKSETLFTPYCFEAPWAEEETKPY